MIVKWSEDDCKILIILLLDAKKMLIILLLDAKKMLMKISSDYHKMIVNDHDKLETKWFSDDIKKYCE